MSATPRSKEHFVQLMTQNQSATVGISLAAKAVYAAKYGFFDANNDFFNRDDYNDIYRSLSSLYGESMNAGQVLAIMTLSKRTL